MFHNKPIRWSVIVLGVVVFIEFAIIIFTISYFQPLGGFDGKIVKPISNFQFKNTLLCSVLHSTHKTGQGMSLPWMEGETFTIDELDSDTPKLLIDGKVWSNLQKTYDSDSYMVLQLKPEGFDTQVFGIMKENGAFVRTMTGDPAGMLEFHYAIAQKGRCE